MTRKSNINLVAKNPKPTVWLGLALNDIQKMPEEVQQAMGKALMVAEFGGKDRQTENFGAGIHEIKVDHDDGSTYRLVYTVEKPLLVYVLHAWMKKSHFKGKMDQKDRNQIERRHGTIEDRYYADVEEKYGVKIDAKTNSIKTDP